MKRTTKYQTFIFFSIGLVLFSGCKPEIESKLLPEVSTEAVSSITQNTAICNGDISSDNGLQITARGICWSLKPIPTINDSLTKDTAKVGKFVCALNNLLCDTTYYIRAYATNNAGTAYGLELTFKTLKGVVPILTTTKATIINEVNIISGGQITFNGGTPITKRGVCWSTKPFPTISNDNTSDGSGSGIFTSSITGLYGGLTYYIRAYATNQSGISYGNQDTIQIYTKPTIKTNVVKSITKTTAISGGTITADGGSLITACGIVWGTTPNPTITLSTKTNVVSGIGSFSCSISELTENRIYYVRAYATNNIGTTYGQELSFETNPSGTFIDSRDGSVYKWIRIKDQVWMAENLRYLPSVVGPDTYSNTTPYYYIYGYYGSNLNNAKTTANYITYGVLYNWSAAINSCPSGWHLPSNDEWKELFYYFTEGELKETGTSHWYSPNSGATNNTGFSALPAGYRSSLGMFYDIGYIGCWWSSTENGREEAWRRSIFYNYNNFHGYYNSLKLNGYSVRCIKD